MSSRRVTTRPTARARLVVSLALGVLCLAGPPGCGDDPGGGGSATGGDQEPAELAGTLDAHNDARAREGLPALVWDGELSQIAADWGAGCADSDGNGLIDHNDGRSESYDTYVGENIYASSGMASGPDAVASWMSEEADYDQGSCSCSGVCGHYTQVMWRQTERLGCALIECPNHRFPSAIICNYAPGGNVGGECPF
jgi:hypothetical protein